MEEYCASSEGSSESTGDKERDQSQDSSSSGNQARSRSKISPTLLATLSEGEDGDVARHINQSSQKVFLNALFPTVSLSGGRPSDRSDPNEDDQFLGSASMWNVDYVLLLQGIRVELDLEKAKLFEEMKRFVSEVFPAMEAYVLQPSQSSLDGKLATYYPPKIKQPNKYGWERNYGVKRRLI